MAFSGFFDSCVRWNFQPPWWVQLKVRGQRVVVFSLEDSQSYFVFMPKFSGDLFSNNRNILVIKRKNTISEIVGKIVENVCWIYILDKRLFTEKSLAFLEFKKFISWQYLSLTNSYFTERKDLVHVSSYSQPRIEYLWSRSVPLQTAGFLSGIMPVLRVDNKMR